MHVCLVVQIKKKKKKDNLSFLKADLSIMHVKTSSSAKTYPQIQQIFPSTIWKFPFHKESVWACWLFFLFLLFGCWFFFFQLILYFRNVCSCCSTGYTTRNTQMDVQVLCQRKNMTNTLYSCITPCIFITRKRLSNQHWKYLANRTDSCICCWKAQTPPSLSV